VVAKNRDEGKGVEYRSTLLIWIHQPLAENAVDGKCKDTRDIGATRKGIAEIPTLKYQRTGRITLQRSSDLHKTRRSGSNSGSKTLNANIEKRSRNYRQKSLRTSTSLKWIRRSYTEKWLPAIESAKPDENRAVETLNGRIIGRLRSRVYNPVSA